MPASPDESTTRRGLRYAVAIWYVLELSLAASASGFWGGKLLAGAWVWGTLLVLSCHRGSRLLLDRLRMRAPLVSVVALAGRQWRDRC